MRRLAILLAALALASPAAAQIKIVSEGKPAVQIRADEFIIHSDAIGRDFLVEVTRPTSLAPGQKAPAIYAIDGGFGVLGPMARLLSGGERMTPSFVVAIGYNNPEGRHIGPRNTDLIHRRSVQNGVEYGGGGAAFEAFLLNDLKPLIEARYAVDPARSVLIGHSGGGLFAVNVLLDKPDAFSAYVIGSADLHISTDLVGKLPTIAAKGGNRRVYVGLARSDIASLGADKVGPALSGPGSTFRVRQEIYDNTTHTAAYLLLAERGLPYVLPFGNVDRPSITVPSATLDSYPGVYRLADGRTVTVTRQGQSLFAALSPNPPIELGAETATKFFARTVNAEITFTPGPDGKVSSLVLRNNGADLVAARAP